MMQDKKLELYIHIPFCVKKCNYCDFLSGSYDDNIKQKYVDALICEIEKESGDYQDYEVDTIYFGGGTPSTLQTNEITRIMSIIERCFNVGEYSEKTIEVNPGTVDLCKLNALKKSGFNRISIGMQSADEAELKMLGRIHSWEELVKCYEASRKALFDNINIDVMTALPGQDISKLDYTLDKVIALNPEHISAYSLIIEEGTKFYDLYGENDEPVVGEEMERKLYWHCVDRLNEAGYKQYEISNFAKEGFCSRHNCGYWTGVEYLGLGLGAASFVNINGKRLRLRNTEDMKRYLKEPLEKLERIEVTIEDSIEEFMFLGLRMRRGVSKSEFTKRFDRNIEEIYGDDIKELVDKGLLSDKGDAIFLTDMGIDYGNYVFSRFLR